MSALRLAGLWAPVVVFVVAIWGLAGETDVRTPIRVWDKALHAGAWFFFALFCLRATHGGVGRLRRGPAMVASALAIGYGLLDEWHQRSIPGRDASMLDVVADACGVLAALLFMGWFGTRIAASLGRRGARGA